MKRRVFLIGLGGAAASVPLGARAQQGGRPVIGFLHAGSPEPNADLVAAFRKGLSETGYVENQNVKVEYRWAGGRDDRLPELAADLVQRQVAVIAVPGTTQAALAAKAATTTIPIVFSTGADPVALGLVASLNRPGGNLTGVTTLNSEVGQKRLGLLRELAPRATHLSALVNPKGPLAESTLKNLREAAQQLGLHVDMLYASTPGEIDAAFAEVAQVAGTALTVSADALLLNRGAQIAALAAKHRLPAIYSLREFAEAGGLMSYGPNFREQFQQVGVYVGRILKGEKAADLPVLQPTKFDLVVNLKTATELGLDIPPSFLALADYVIE
jgi:putative tryptophan/tyrosine transport system substrate-binding protein